MMQENLKLFLLLFLIILLKYPTFNLSYHWDETNYVYYGKWFSSHGLFSIPPNHDGHVPLFSWILAIGIIMFSETHFLSHLIIAFLSSITVYFTYLLGKFLYNKDVGIMASLLMFFSPVYFAISGQALIDIPLVAFTVITLYFGLKKKMNLYIISACLLVLIKEPGFLVIIALSLYQLIKKEKPKVISIYLAPILVLLIWLFWYFTQTGNTGWFKLSTASGKALNIGSLKLPIPVSSLVFYKIVAIIYQIFFWNYNWILTLIMCIVIISRKKFKFKKDSIPLLITGGLFFIVFSFIAITFLPRYLLPLYPFFFIFSAYTLDSFKRKWIIFLIIIILFISAYRWNWGLKGFIQDPVFHSTIFYPKIITSVKNGELNLDYIDIVKIEKEALDFIFRNYKNSTITATNPMVYPHCIGVIDVGYRQWIKNNVTVLYPVNEENIKKSNLVIVESYSNWYYDNKDKFSNIFSKLEIIKKFEENGKVLIVYKGGK